MHSVDSSPAAELHVVYQCSCFPFCALTSITLQSPLILIMCKNKSIVEWVTFRGTTGALWDDNTNVIKCQIWWRVVRRRRVTRPGDFHLNFPLVPSLRLLQPPPSLASLRSNTWRLREVGAVLIASPHRVSSTARCWWSVKHLQQQILVFDPFKILFRSSTGVPPSLC